MSKRTAADVVRRKPKPSRHPQRINSMLWYYENVGSIDVIVDVPELLRRGIGYQPWKATIPKKRLLKSLSRMVSQ